MSELKKPKSPIKVIKAPQSHKKVAATTKKVLKKIKKRKDNG